MKILVLGATGQIGYALTLALSQTEHQVSVLVRNAAGLHFPDNVTVIERGKFTRDALRSAARDVDHAIYSLGLPEQFLFDNSAFETVNVDLLETFLGAMQNSTLRRLTYISTYETFKVIDGVIDETHPIADENRMSPYSQSKVRAYRRAVEFSRANQVQLTTIHPAAVFGGINTGGVTDYMTSLATWRCHRVPFINAGHFPVVHVDSLADLIIKSLDKPGAYIASDQMTTLKDIARSMRMQVRSYVPVVMPLGLVRLGVLLMEAVAKIIRIRPLASTVQTDFLTRGWRPESAKAIRELGWKPMSLQEGLRRFLLKDTSSSRGELGFRLWKPCKHPTTVRNLSAVDHPLD